MADASTKKYPRARLLPQGTLLCPACGDVFPLHSSCAIMSCNRCNAKVDIGSRLSSTAPGAVDVVRDLVAAAKEANERHQRERLSVVVGNDGALGASAASEIAASKKKKDTRQTEDCLCEKCGVVRKCFTYALQIRGADEGQTIFYECSSCSTKWSLNS